MYSVRDAARMLGCSETTVRRHMPYVTLDGYRACDGWRLYLNDIQAIGMSISKWRTKKHKWITTEH